MARQIVVFALVLIALVGLASAAAAGSKASSSPAPAPGGASSTSSLAAGSPESSLSGVASPTEASAPGPASGGNALEVSAMAGVGAAARTLREAFQEYGIVRDVYIAYNNIKRIHGRLTFAFVRFDYEADARRAIDRAYGRKMDGEKIKVLWAKKRQVKECGKKQEQERG
ncbi:hypothetical protein V6N11_084151 [Hibiscus sabdariffa]|uniref:RRM domain-containing protein n=1 Tax=Hibiscus sabdariffa TaxID=183260 RepID=A0ABR1Z738_9ROSI